MAVNWTPEQLQAIEDRGHNLLVSASAGSGKTTVMIERIFRLIHENHIPINEFLIVTFTKASACDMKEKLTEKLAEFADDEFVLSQIENLSVADISNLHSFCSKLITTYFYEVNIDPSYKIIDESESAFLKEKALKLLFEEKEKNGDEEFFNMFEIFQQKRSNKNLKDVIIRFNNFLNTNLNSDEFIRNSVELSYSSDLEKNECAKIINRYVSHQAKEDAEKLAEFAKYCLEVKADKLSEHFYDLSEQLKAIKLSNSYMANARNIFAIKIERTPIVPKDLKFLSGKVKALKDEVKDNIENYKKNYVSDDEEFLKTGLNVSKKHLLYLYELTKEFNEKYSKLKLNTNGLDFNDLEKYALKILENPTIRDAVRDKYKYVFVDEYQDINSVQEKIISLVSGTNNRFMVGDVKQSIYRFRLCNPDIFLQKYEEYKGENKDSKLIKLNCNFRSDKKILRFVDNIFAGRMTEEFGGLNYDKDSRFVPGENNCDEKDSVNLIFNNTETEPMKETIASGVYSVKNHENIETIEQKKAISEAVIVKNEILKLISPENPGHMNFSDIAILFATRNATVSKFAETLRDFGIPVAGDDKNDLMEKPHIKQLVSFAKYLVNPKDDFETFKILKSDFFKFSDNELADIRKDDFSCRFYECLEKYENIANDDLKNKIKSFYEKIEKYRELSKFLTIKDLMKKIVKDFCLKNINLLNENGEEINDDIDSFICLLPSVGVFDYVKNYADSSLELESEGGGDAVRMMTIHKSKGIEFKAVFVINLANNFNFKSTYGSILFNKDLGVGLDYFDLDSRCETPTIAISAIRIVEKRKLIEEQQRVLYVGLTRAKKKLFVVCSKDENALSETFANRHKAFIEWFEKDIIAGINGTLSSDIHFEKYCIDDLLDTEKNEKKQLLLTKTKVKEPEWYEYKFKDSLAIPAKSSISKIIKLQEELDDDDENAVIYENISSAKRGTAYHKVFEKIDFYNLQNISQQIDNIFKTELSEEELCLVDRNIVAETLNLSIFKNIMPTDKILKEREFFAQVPTFLLFDDKENDENVIIQGVFDLVIFRENETILIDYKTGKISEEKLKKYKFQMDIYSYSIAKAFGKNVTKRILVLIDEKIMQEI